MTLGMRHCIEDWCLRCTATCRLRVFDLPAEAYTNDEPKAETVSVAGQDSFDAALQVQEGELVYDYAWYSRMHTSDPVSCCFATTVRVRQDTAAHLHCLLAAITPHL